MNDVALYQFTLFLIGAFALMLVITLAFKGKSFLADTKITDWLGVLFTLALAWFTYSLAGIASKQTAILSATDQALHASADTAEKFRLFTEATNRGWVGPTSAGLD